MKKKIIASVLAGLLGLVLLFGACGAKQMDSFTYASYSPAPQVAYDTTMPAGSAANYRYTVEEEQIREEADYNDYADLGGGEIRPTSIANEIPQPEKPAGGGRKIIKDVYASVETRQFDRFIAAAETKTNALGGYVESRSAWNGSNYYYSDKRSADLVLRVPADALDAFMEGLEEFGKVMNSNESKRDVTASYTDTQAHIGALKTEREALLRLMDKADSLKDLLQVQDRLTQVRYQLDSLESQLRVMDEQIALSTVTLHVEEVERVAPEKPEGFFAKTWANFKENLFAVGRGLRDFVSGLLSAIPYLAAIAAPAALIIWLILRRRKKRRASRG